MNNNNNNFENNVKQYNGLNNWCYQNLWYFFDFAVVWVIDQILSKFFLYVPQFVTSIFFDILYQVWIFVSLGDITFNIGKNRGNIFKFVSISSFFSFNSVVEFTVIDYFNQVPSFFVIYVLLSYSYIQRIVICYFLDDKQLVVSQMGEYSSLDWLESEVYDMFGIIFLGHNNLSSILTDYGFKWFPLSKDYPTSGFVELLYSSYLDNFLYLV